MKKIRKNKEKILSLFLIMFLVIPVFSGCGRDGGSTNYSMDLEIWGVFDDKSDYLEIIDEYTKINPFIERITYKKQTIENYREDLLDALASGNGPDIFMINNSWMPSFEDKVALAPDYIINEQQFRNNFVDVAADDFLNKTGEVYGVPMSVDSLALYYNKDLFNAAGISSPPETWEEVVEDSKKITRINDIGDIERSGIAMGTSYNINRSSNIIDLLLFQHGAQLPDKNDTFFDVDINLGNDVLEFYTQFARSSSPAYSWNNAMHYSIDSFYEGDLAMMLNYSWHVETLKSKNAKLNFAIAKVPQLTEKNPSTVANYWSFVVNKNKENDSNTNKSPVRNEDRMHEAWQFLKFISFKNNGSFNLINARSKEQKTFSVGIDPTKNYLEKTIKPAARRDLLEEQKNDPMMGAFAYGNLIARSWYMKDTESIENIWAEIISSINKGEITAMEGFNIAKTRINDINR